MPNKCVKTIVVYIFLALSKTINVFFMVAKQKNMKKTLLTISMTFLLSHCVSAQSDKMQEDPDFNGIWVLDKESKSLNYPGSSGGDIVDALNIIFIKKLQDYTLTIVQTKSEIKITRIAILDGKAFSDEMILYPDARGEKNKGAFTDTQKEIESKTEIKKNSIIRKYRGDNSFRVEKYSLSKDGKKLDITYSSHGVSSSRSGSYKLTFIKKES